MHDVNIQDFDGGPIEKSSILYCFFKIDFLNSPANNRLSVSIS